MEKSTHKVEVIRIDKIHPHANADSLGIVYVWDYSVCVRLSDWKEGDLAAYVPPDSVVPDTEQFAFLDGHRRVRARKLRGVVSFGMLIQAPDGSSVGDDVAAQIGIEHYEPELHAGSFVSSDTASPPPGYHPTYDVDTLRRHRYMFSDGELVIPSEKIHGSNWRAVFIDGEFYVGSRNLWKKPSDKDMYWTAFYNEPKIAETLERHPGLTLYGEVVPCQKMGKVLFDYGCSKPTVFFFDALRGNRFLDYYDLRSVCKNLPVCPTITDEIEFDFGVLEEFSEGPTLTAGRHIREGIVIRPIHERVDPVKGRALLKLVSATFLEKS
jgi:RNA ligase (TIGR02306 family)